MIRERTLFFVKIRFISYFTDTIKCYVKQCYLTVTQIRLVLIIMYYFTCNVIWFTGRIIVFKRRGCIYYTFGLLHIYHNKYVVIQTVRNCVTFEIAIICCVHHAKW